MVVFVYFEASMIVYFVVYRLFYGFFGICVDYIC